MCAKKTKGKHRLDKFYHLAKEQGFRSRAAFKLVQLNKKYDFLGNARSLLDLCAAPGGWLQVAHKYMPLQSLIVGIDIVPIKPIRGVITITEDITTERCRTAIKKTLPTKDALFDVVVCDGAPNVGGAWARESYAQAALILDACKLATEFLAPKGMFITKVFRSQEYHALLYAFQQLFDRVESTKPMASRATSAEIYVVCKGYKAPAKIDKRLLDPAHMFAETQDDAPRVIDVLNPKEMQKRNRGGYEAGTGVLYKECSAEDFVTSDKPADILGMYNKLIVAPESEIAEHRETTQEILELVADLRVLGRKEFKQLLKWRQEIIKTRLREEKEALKGEKKEKGDKAADGEEEDQEEKLMQEMEELQQRTEARKRREKKKLAKLKTKARERAAVGAAGQDKELAKEGAFAQEDDLFSLSSLRSKRALDKVADTTAPDADELEEEEAEEEEDDGGDERERHYGHTGDSGSDDDGRGEDDAAMETELDSLYTTYAKRRGIKAERELKRARARLGKGGELQGGEGEWPEEEEDDWDDPEGQAKKKKKAAEKKKAKEEQAAAEARSRGGEEDDSDFDSDSDAPNPLLAGRRPVKPNASAQALASQWFSNPAFSALHRAGGEEGAVAPSRTAAKRPAARDIDLDSSDDDGGEGGSDLDDVRTTRRAPALGAKSGARANGAAKGEDDDDFETVAADENDDASVSGSSESDDRELDLLDDDTKAEIRAYGKLLRHRKTREALIDSSYNKRVFNDEDAPEWFLSDERRHNRAHKPITAAEVKEAKAALRALNARPIKKIAEAKARKRQRVTMKMEAARNKANAIADQEDMPMKSRMREIERVYARAHRAIKGKGGAKGGKGGKGPTVDKRLKKDKRSTNKKGDKKNANRKNPRGGGGGGNKKKGSGGGGGRR